MKFTAVKMDLKYDSKFEEMKKYIPFLESMIKRLETSSSGSANPRQAQLDKIRSLRDLLLDKKKRMKMENLLKCEQVLVNLYAKVEQRDTKLEPIHPVETVKSTDKQDLESVRHKLKSVVKRQVKAETLPEIARASEIEEICTPGSKEPALFQRRPHKYSMSPRSSPTLDSRSTSSNQTPNSKRNYTRVLVSPEPGSRPLFSRRSPRRSPKRYSPTYNKKERKKASKQQSKDLNITLNVPEESLNSLNTKDILSRIINCSDGDVDIDTLRELRTQILGELKQTGASDDISDLILKSYKNKKTNKKPNKNDKKAEVEEGELSDSESEAIESIYGSLVVVEKDASKSNQVKKLSEADNQPRKIQICLVINADKDGFDNNTEQKLDQTIDVSDFEMYDDKDKGKINNISGLPDKEHLREKITDGDKTKHNDESTCENKNNVFSLDNSADGTCENKNNLFSLDNNADEDKNNKFSLEKCTYEEKNEITKQSVVSQDKDTSVFRETSFIDEDDDSLSSISSSKDKDDIGGSVSTDKLDRPSLYSRNKSPKGEDKKAEVPDSNDLLEQMLKRVTEPSQFKANFYKPIIDHGNTETFKSTAEVKKAPESKVNTTLESQAAIATIDAIEPKRDTKTTEELEELLEQNVEIPLLHEKTVPEQPPEKPVVSEIDILQALKNEILSEAIAIPGSESITPALHQPKISKVANAQGILPKKRISIEKYKQKTVSSKPVFGLSKDQDITLPDNSKKQSLKLTEKECERFNFPTKLALDDDDYDEDDLFDTRVEEKSNITVEDIYADLAPKSPDCEEERNLITTTPVIIPADPVKTTITSSKADIDMRTLLPLVSPNTMNMCATSINKPPLLNESLDAAKIETNREVNKGGSDKIRSSLADPRVRRDINQSVQKNSPNSSFEKVPLLPNPAVCFSSPNNICEKVPLLPNPIVSYTNVTPNITPNMTPILNPSMTPNRTPILNPSMTPIMTPNARSYEMTPSHQTFEVDSLANRKHVYAPMFPAFDPREAREQSVSKEIHPVWERNEQPVWERNDIASDNRKGRRDGRKSNWDDPRSSSVQREAPELQNSRYSESYKYQKEPRSDRYSVDKRDNYKRGECPLTPLPSFGRSEGSSTPMHPFGRSDCPTTPSHPFGRSECPPTPSHPFGRSECPPTPSHPFGRSECPPTPSHVFGRSECPATPSHPFGRSECPSTPSHPFGRSEGLPTTSHSYDRLDCPTTPSHPFGRSECPLTPNHPFGRNDMPMTPGHPFERQEFSQNPKFNKDPRLNRSSEHESNNKYNERDRNYYKERGINRSNSYKSHSRSFNDSDNFSKNDRNQSIGKYDRNSYYSHDQSERYNNRDQMSRGDSSVGRNTSKDYEDDRSYYRKRSSGKYSNEHSKTFEEVGTRRGFCRERSVGRNLPSDVNFTRSTSRAQSIGRDNPRESDIENSLSVKSHAGRSFTIDTSVNATFQDFIESGKGIQVFDYSFDDRKRRSASVGRSLAREPNIGSTLPQASKPINENVTDYKKNNFRRACSVGRDIITDTKIERSLKDIKADFETFRSSLQLSKTESKKIEPKDTYELNTRTKKDVHETQQNKNTSSSKTNKAYSPRKNYRDPRMRREQFKDSKNSRDSRERKSDGIVYSNDNIAKGTILGSGYGVKNYKIPKIKRAVEEKEEKEKDLPKKPELSEKTASEKKLVPSSKAIENKSNSKNIKDFDKTDDEIERRITRSRNSDLSKSIKNTNKTRKNRKAVILDSDSETEVDKDSKISEDSDSNRSFNEAKKSTSRIINATPSPTKQKKNVDCTRLNELDSSFGMDDLDMFSENIVSDPVIDNINALIADLDNDLDTSKNDTNDKFTNEFTMENMLESITSPESDHTPETVKEKSIDSSIISFEHKANDNNPEVSIKSIPPKPDKDSNEEYLENTLNTKNDDLVEKLPIKPFENITKKNTDKEYHKPEVSIKSNQPKNDKDSNEEHIENIANTKNHTLVGNLPIKPFENNIEKNIDRDENKSSNDAIVSTTGTEKERHSKKVEDKVDELLDGGSNDGCSTPDSTINNDKTVIEKSRQVAGLPDSTNDTQIEMNSDVTSTHDTTEIPSHESSETHTHDISDTLVKDNAEPSSSRKEGTPAIESIGSLLSMLKDRSKIEEILSLLGDKSGENERLMKKLNKLREIVSDEEDANDDEINKNEKLDVSKKSEDLSTINNELSNTRNVNSSLDDKEFLLTDDSKCTDKSNTNKEKLEEKAQKDLKSKQEVDLKEMDIKTAAEINTDTVHDANMSQKESPLVLESTQKPEKTKAMKKPPLKKTRFMKKSKGKIMKKSTPSEPKRVTRAGLVNYNIDKTPVVKKPSRELLKLHEDIKEMFIRDDVLNATGIRMCRLAKLVDEKITNEGPPHEVEPVVVLEKFKNVDGVDQPSLTEKRIKKKPGPKPKVKITKNTSADNESKVGPIINPKYKPGPKSKTKVLAKSVEEDPYAFETDSVGDTSITKAIDGGHESSSDYESGSLASSFGSTELLADLKKNKKRKRRGWQAGVIKPKKKKMDTKQSDSVLEDEPLPPQTTIIIPDMNCFIDKNYCFRKNVFTYSCRLCVFTGKDIVHHYKKHHPHSEIPLSRMNPPTAKEAIEQCEEINFQAISKIPTEKYVCRFCYKEFGKSKAVLEIFFWHVVSMHTGEYKQACSECVNVNRCPFDLDIPPPPKDIKGQLIGYICGKCNFTQISLENLKTHVIVRHNDEQTEVYTINLASMTKKGIAALTKRCNTNEKPRVLRSLRSNQSVTDFSDDRSDITDSSHASEPEPLLTKSEASSPISQIIQSPKPPLQMKTIPIQSKITFEADDNTDTDLACMTNEDPIIESSVKIEPDDSVLTLEGTIHINDKNDSQDEASHEHPIPEIPIESDKTKEESNDIVQYPHFKINFTESGSKEYVCCINGKDNHYKTALMISMKKHVQMKHTEKWDGYCCICKVIVTPQGLHHFKDCLQHYLDKHMDNFPVLEKLDEETRPTEVTLPDGAVAHSPTLPPLVPIEITESPKTYINVRPLADLIPKEDKEATPLGESPFPKIESVVSLGSPLASTLVVEPSRASPIPKTVPKKKIQIEKLFDKYEEAQAEIMSKKHQVVLDTMMTKDKLLQVYKCAGRYCSFTSDSPEEAIIHASTHQRIGGENALYCSYCDYDSSGNAIDLVMHVFKVHGRCQYSCAQCFYRAAASQLVGAHITRIHGEAPTAGSVLRTTSISQAVGEDVANMLTREEAVPYYVCKHEDSDGACKFRTYTSGKFHDHLLQKHGSATAFPCSLCPTMGASPTELVQHMKSHGLRLYQCTWCVHGADNEAELLNHTSAVHPTKQPQAYLRIITNKLEGSEMRVLPLAYLNKSKVPTEDVTPSGNKENPIKEAERSIELEKLIGFTNVLIASTSDMTAVPDVEEDITTIDIPDPEPEPLPVSIVSEPPPISTLSPRLLTPPHATIPNINEQLTPVLKSEAIENTPVKELPSDVVYCLDSDEEEPVSNVIDLSGDLSKTTTDSSIEGMRYKKIPPLVLFKCPGCNGRFRTPNGFKRHFCPLNTAKNIKCPHCQLLTEDKNELTKHYVTDHVDVLNHMCGICDMGFTGLLLAKRHLKEVHKVTYIGTLSKTMPNGGTKFIVNESEKGKALQKRKLSTDKTRRYGPQDIDKLPINPILDSLVYCSLCEFNTKVRLNMVRHLQQHTEQQPVPQTAPVNPVPHLETNEKHFDKMVNLASSSVVNRTPDKATKHDTPTVTLLIPPEAASRYPKYIPERQRHACGAKGCSYISVSEVMLKCHWETLHSDTNDFHCVHCPPYQHLDTSKPLTASRIIAHLKMHDVSLYACSSCSYYHHKRLMVEKHLAEVHKNSQLRVVREEAMPALSAAVPSTSAPTMDLKPWQCGLCQFKSMIRPEVAEHCAKLHQSKMQFKCAYCPFRTSMKENVTKHQLNSHPGKIEDVFYYYYREDSIPNEDDGTPRWMKQRQKCGITESEVKTEVADASLPNEPILPSPHHKTQSITNPALVDLNLVKKEVYDSSTGESIEELCKKFGQFCEPNGMKYKCPLCKVVTEPTAEAMQSHLYEELKYRKWSCTICSYKAFHKTGLNEHMASEHRRQYQQPLELPVDANIEKWVAKQIEYQTEFINKNKETLSKLQMQTKTNEKDLGAKTSNLVVTAVTAGPSRAKKTDKSQTMATLQPAATLHPVATFDPAATLHPAGILHPVALTLDKHRLKVLEEALGTFGAPKNGQLCCPKCNLVVNDAFMRNHLESELSKIRWSCSNCTDQFQTYHEAQYHCKSVHPGLLARPNEATRDPAVRDEWVTAVITQQRRLLKSLAQNTFDANLEPICSPEETFSDSNENSLLVVRYEESVQTPEGATLTRKRSASPDSDDGELVIDSSDEVPRKKLGKNCPYCPYSNPQNFCLKAHILKHYDLRPYKCSYCDFSGYSQSVERHIEVRHRGLPSRMTSVPIPDHPPTSMEVPKLKRRSLVEDDSNVFCLTCETYLSDSAKSTHVHENLKVEFAKKGSVVVKCCVCLMLRVDIKSLQIHHNECHPNVPINYAFVKVQADLKDMQHCGHCTKHFRYLRDLVAHHNTVHNYLTLKYTTGPYVAPSSSSPIEIEDDTECLKRQSSDTSIMPQPKRIAKKSTSKLPVFKTVARKSTTKLPDTRDSDSDSDEEYSYYGTSPMPQDKYANVTTLMPFFNNMVPFTFKKLSEIIKIDPKVVVKDIKK